MFENPLIPSSFILSSHWLLVVGFSLRVIARRLPVGVSLAWITVMFAVPFVGTGAYLIIGGNRLGRKRIAQQVAAQKFAEKIVAAMRASDFARAADASSPGILLYRQTVGLLGIPALGDNGCRLLIDFNDVFQALVDAIDNAETSCCLAFYIWQEGGLADEVLQALLRARSRGVHCRVLVDSVGSWRFLRGRGVRKLRAAGVQVISALPRSFGRRRDLRNHRKIVVIDSQLAFTGSQNLVDPRFFKRGSGVGEWVDAVLCFEGPAVTLLQNIFELDWSVEAGSKFAAPPLWSGSGRMDLPLTALLHIVPSGPAPQPDAIRQLLLTAIYSARETLTLTTPYFVPDEAIVTALLSAALRGVRVTLVVPAKNDSLLVRYASVAHFNELLSAGVRIALFQGGLLHTKSMLIDDSVSVFGSVNLDMRSFWLNFEISLIGYGGDLSKLIGDLQRDYISRSKFLDKETWLQRSAGRRFLENAARLAGPLL